MERFAKSRTAIFALLIVALTFAPASAQARKARIADDLAAEMQAGSPSANVRVIIVPRAGDDVDAVSEKVKAAGGNVRGSLRHVRLIVAETALENIEALRATEGVEYIAPDRPTNALGHLQTTTGTTNVQSGSYNLLSFLSGSMNYDGTGVGVAIIDSGIDGEHYDLRLSGSGQKRVIFAADFTGTGSLDDPYGHGTHVAGIVGGDGASSGTLYGGIATRANLLNLRVLDSAGRGFVSNVIRAIDYAISIRQTYNVRVLNLSLAAPPVDSYRDDPLCQAVERATGAGLVVVVSAGNFGVDSYGNKLYGGIASPGNSPAAITVGATDTFGTNTRSDDRIAPYSSRGPTRSHRTDPLTGAIVYDNLPKPDLVAPGFRVVSLERSDNAIVRAYPAVHVTTLSLSTKTQYMFLSGTSMSAGVVSGAAALIVQANPSLTPNMVKAILMYSAQMIDGPDVFEQGAGNLNVDGAVRLARAMRQDAGRQLPGTGLIAKMPPCSTTIAGETFAWAQGLIWGASWGSGSALMTQMQTAYSQGLVWGWASSLIWGMRGAAWGAGVTLQDGLYSDNHVAYGQSNAWLSITPGASTTADTGALCIEGVGASGGIWQNGLISEAFFTVDSTSLVWGFRDSGLIWGVTDRYLLDMALIWGL